MERFLAFLEAGDELSRAKVARIAGRSQKG
jgi:hypothetical protein